MVVVTCGGCGGASSEQGLEAVLKLFKTDDRQVLPVVALSPVCVPCVLVS